MIVPKDRRYTETHEWARVEKKKVQKGRKVQLVTVGITDYAVSRLSDLVHVELPEPGGEYEQGVPFGEIESVKTVSDLYAPVSGKLVERNEDVIASIDLVSRDPYEEGWLVRFEIEDEQELEGLLSPEDYENHVKTEEEDREGGGEEDDDEGFFM